MKTILDIKNRILETLSNQGRTAYFTVYSVSGKEIKLRVGNHSGNKRNNGDAKTLSFISNRTTQRQSAYNSIIEEWEIDLENELTDTFQTIEQVLEWEDVSNDQEAAEELYFENL
ncbi:hypothetical protein [Chryseobacterium sp. MYb328]|uniref:hypothetical protein n=1 Tax=Chryseobacterium sp. MYb328 TaxID=2745231 RepID=UPI0030AF5451